LPIADCQFEDVRLPKYSWNLKIGNWQSAIGGF
jgi:hypothetical protein